MRQELRLRTAPPPLAVPKRESSTLLPSKKGLILSETVIGPTFQQCLASLMKRSFFGRWATEDEVILGFVNPLPTNFTIELEAAAFGPNVNRPIKILVGGKEQEFLLNSGHPEKMQTTRLRIAGVESAESIKLRIPFATPPKALVGSPRSGPGI
jgi:hypothetical protein